MPFKVLVVGGAGDMGRWCSKLFKDMGFDVYISSRRDISDIARSIGVKVATQEQAGDFDIVILSVPIDMVDSVASRVAPLMRPNSLIMDLSSLKKGPVEAMLKYVPPGVEVIGAHPLFGPGIGTMKGRTVVLTPTERCAKWLPIIKDIFEEAGAGVEVTTAEDHDRRMAIVQGLTHFMYISMGLTLKGQDIDIKDTEAYQTPVYSITKDMAGRVLSQNPGMYALIQSSDSAKSIRRAYIESCRQLDDMLCSGDIEGFISSMKSAAMHYGDTEGARKRTERIIRKALEDVLSIRDSVGKERAFALEGVPDEVYGIVKEGGKDYFRLDTPSGTMTIRYEDATLLGNDRLDALKAAAGPRISRDIQVKLPIGSDANVLKWVLTRIDGVAGVNVETCDALNSRYIVYRFTVSTYQDRSEEALQKVLSTIWGLGFEVK